MVHFIKAVQVAGKYYTLTISDHSGSKTNIAAPEKPIFKCPSNYNMDIQYLSFSSVSTLQHKHKIKPSRHHLSFLAMDFFHSHSIFPRMQAVMSCILLYKARMLRGLYVLLLSKMRPY